MIRILVVDDHEAIRAGLTAVLEATPDLVPVATAADEVDMWPALQRTRPDVVLLDYHLPSSDGLALCRRIKRWAPAPAVLLYSAYAGSGLHLPALLAGADGVLSKASPAGEIAEAVRAAAAGRLRTPEIVAEDRLAAAQRLGPEEQAIVAMAAAGTAHSEIAETLGLDAHQMDVRVEQIIAALKVEIATP